MNSALKDFMGLQDVAFSRVYPSCNGGKGLSRISPPWPRDLDHERGTGVMTVTGVRIAMILRLDGEYDFSLHSCRVVLLTLGASPKTEI